MTEQELARTEITSPLVDQRDLRSPQAVGTIVRWVQANKAHLFIHQPSILSGVDMLTVAASTRPEPVTTLGPPDREPGEGAPRREPLPQISERCIRRGSTPRMSRRRPPYIELRRPVYIGCEGASEVSYAGFLQDLIRDQLAELGQMPADRRPWPRPCGPRWRQTGHISRSKSVSI